MGAVGISSLPGHGGVDGVAAFRAAQGDDGGGVVAGKVDDGGVGHGDHLLGLDRAGRGGLDAAGASARRGGCCGCPENRREGKMAQRAGGAGGGVSPSMFLQGLDRGDNGSKE